MSSSKQATREWTPDMGEISGFGGGYEDACRRMALAGMDWLDANPAADPKFKGFRNVYGLVVEDNDDAKALSAAITSVCDDCTGAMHQACVSHALAYKRLGWDEYCRQLREREAKETA